MTSLISRARAPFVALGVFLSQAAVAADMPFFSPPPLTPVNDGPVEFGTGWYLRGDIGPTKINLTNIDGVNLSQSFPNNWTGGLGGGYKYNNWFRTDLTFDYESLYRRSGPQYVLLPCQIGAVGTPVGGAGVFTGSRAVYAGCSPFIQSRNESLVIMANAYFDLGNWYGITPYVGTGVGVNIMYQKAQVNWYMQNLVPYAGTTWTDPFTKGTYMANWDRTQSATELRVSYAFMAGLAYDVTDHIKIDLGYRWLNMGRIEGVDLYNNRISKDLISNQLRVGFRYMVD